MKKIIKILLILVWILAGAGAVLPLIPGLESVAALVAEFRNYLIAGFVALTLIGIASLVIRSYHKEVNDDEKKLELKSDKKTPTNKEVEELFADLQLAEFTLDGEEKPGAKVCETLNKKRMLREALVVTTLSKKEKRKVEKQQQRAEQKAARQRSKNEVYLINNIPRNDLMPIRNRKNGWAVWLFLIVFYVAMSYGLAMLTALNPGVEPTMGLLESYILLGAYGLAVLLFLIIFIVSLVKRKNVLPAFGVAALIVVLVNRYSVYLCNEFGCLNLNNVMSMLTNVNYMLLNVGFLGTVVMLIIFICHYSKAKYVYLTHEQVKAREDKLNKKDKARVAKYEAQLAAEEAARKAEEERLAEEKRLAEEEEARKAEEERLAAEEAEAARLAAEEEARKADEERLAEEEAARKEAELQAELERLAAEEEARKTEEERLAEEEAARKEAELRAEVERIVAEEVAKRRLAREEEERLIAEEKAAKERLAAEEAEAARLAEEEEIKKEAARMARIEVLVAKEVARILNEDKLAREEAERKAKEEEAARLAAEERKATIERLAREEAARIAAEEEAARKAEEERLAAEEAERKAKEEAERLAAEEAERKAREEEVARIAAEEEEARKAEEERLAAEEAERKAEEERLAAEEAKRLAEIKARKPIKLKPMPKAKVNLFDGLDANVAGGWGQYIAQEQEKDYYKELMAFVKTAYEKNNVYPTKENLFKCFEYTDITNAKVVILGKLPFYRKDQADGLAYSTKAGSAMNQTTKVIVQEAVNDVGIKNAENGSFVPWAKQGVLLLNSIMTAPADKPASHQNCGWMQFTDGIIETLNNDDRPKVFILWGEHARERAGLITNPKHLVLEAPNPSPLSAANGFYGSKPFSKTNEFLTNNGYEPINWEL